MLRKLANAILRPVSPNFFHGNTKRFLKTGRKQISLLAAGRKIWGNRQVIIILVPGQMMEEIL